MNWTDLYSNQPNSANGTGQLATGPVGPNQSIVTGAGQVSAGGAAANAAGSAFSWLGLVLGLVMLRLLISFGGRVA